LTSSHDVTVHYVTYSTCRSPNTRECVSTSISEVQLYSADLRSTSTPAKLQQAADAESKVGSFNANNAQSDSGFEPSILALFRNADYESPMDQPFRHYSVEIGGSEHASERVSYTSKFTQCICMGPK